MRALTIDQLRLRLRFPKWMRVVWDFGRDNQRYFWILAGILLWCALIALCRRPK